MNVHSLIVKTDLQNFETSPHRLRVLASAAVLPDHGPGWHVGALIGPGLIDANIARGADCWLLAAADLAGIDADLVARSALPVVVMIDAGSAVAEDWLERADGFVLPGDDAAAIGAVLAQVTAPAGLIRVADLSDGTARAINALSAEASRIAEQLARLAEAERAPPAPQAIEARLVRRIIKLRRDRERFFPAEILADPAWDMLLDLTAARLEGKRVPVSSLCIAAAVPTTTALRWIRSLTEAGLLERYNDPGDARRSHIEIAEGAAQAMFAWLRAFNDAFALR